MKDKKYTDLGDIVYGGKLPPQAIDLEEAVLGAVMIDKNAIYQVISILSGECFYHDAHKLIWEAIISLHSQKKPIDILMVSEELRSIGSLETVGGAFYVVQLTTNVASSANIEYHTHVIIEKFLKRQIINLSAELGKKAFDDQTDVFELQAEISKNLLDIHFQIQGLKGKSKDWNVSVSETLNSIESAMNTSNHISGIPTGNKILDALTGGWQKTDLIILAARPGMGKTARALSFMKAAVLAGYKIQMYSFEMSSMQLVKRLLSEATGIDLQDLNRGRLSQWSKEDIDKAAEVLKQLPIKVNDNGRTTLHDMANDCRVLKSKGEIDFLIVDFLQICKIANSSSMNRNDIIGVITGELKNIAKECDIPVLALCAMSRKADSRSDKRGTMEDLREGGSIESDADVVIIQFRPSYYTKGDISKEKSEEFRDMEENQYKQHSELIIEKHRNGKTGVIIEYFDGATQKYTTFWKKENPLYSEQSANYVDVNQSEENLPF